MIRHGSFRFLTLNVWPMRIHLSLLACCLFFLQLASAQNDADKKVFYKQLDTVPDNRHTYVIKSRQLLFTYMTENRIDQLAELTFFVAGELSDNDGIALYPFEEILLYFRIGRHDKVLEYLKRVEAGQEMGDGHYITASDDLRLKLISYSCEFRKLYQEEIARSGRPGQEQTVLSLCLDYLLQRFDPEISQDRINAECNRFLQEWPDSGWTATIKDFRHEWEPGNFGMGFHLAGGYTAFTGKLNDYFKNNATLGISWDFFYKRWLFSLDLAVTNTKLQQDMIYDFGTWEKGKRAFISRFAVQTGFSVINREKHRLSPFVSIGGLVIGAHDDDIKENKYLEDAGVNFAFTPAGGIQYEVRLWKKDYNTLRDNYALRFRYTLYAPQFRNHHNLDGCIHELTVGFVLSLQNLKRKQ